jgi:flagellar biosynthetic protein FliO
MAEAPLAVEPAASSAAAVPLPAFEASPWLALATTLLSLLVVLALAWAMLRWLRRSQGGSASAGELQVLRAASLGARERLVVVRHRDTEYLLGVTAASVTVIDRQRVDAVPQGQAEP